MLVSGPNVPSPEENVNKAEDNREMKTILKSKSQGNNRCFKKLRNKRKWRQNPF